MTPEDRAIWRWLARGTLSCGLVRIRGLYEFGPVLTHISGAQDARDAQAMHWYQDAGRYWTWVPASGRIEDNMNFIDIRGIPIDVSDPRHPDFEPAEFTLLYEDSASHNGDFVK